MANIIQRNQFKKVWKEGATVLLPVNSTSQVGVVDSALTAYESTLNQQNTTGASNDASSDLWQSFTPSINGLFGQWAARLEQSAGTDMVFDVFVYLGQGTGGALLASEENISITTVDTGGSVIKAFFDFNEPPLLTAAQEYTVHLVLKSGGPGGIRWREDIGGNPYAGGRASTAALDDFVFDATLYVLALSLDKDSLISSAGLNISATGSAVINGGTAFDANVASVSHLNLNASQVRLGTATTGIYTTRNFPIVDLSVTPVPIGSFTAAGSYLFVITTIGGDKGTFSISAGLFVGFIFTFTIHNESNVSVVEAPAGTFTITVGGHSPDYDLIFNVGTGSATFQLTSGTDVGTTFLKIIELKP